MKKTFQRWLAMLLAVLMVMGTLPTSAWAARREEEFAEQPVIGEGDGVTDTLGKHDDGGEYPVDPVDPSDPPADLNDVNITAVTPSGGSMVDGRYEISGLSSASFSGTVTVGTGDPNDQIAVLIFPNYATRAGVDTPASTWKGLDFVGTFVNDGNQTNVKNALSTYANGEPYYFLRTNSVAAPSVVFHGSQDELKDTAGNSLSPINKPTQVEFTDGDKSWFEPDYLNGKTNIYLANSTTPINVSEMGVPFTVFIGGSSGFHYADVWIKGSNQPLKVEIVDPQAHKPHRLPTDDGDDYCVYTTINVINNSGAPLANVTVTVNRAAPVTNQTGAVPGGWSTTPVDADEDGDDITNRSGIYLRWLYGLEGADKTSPYNQIKFTSLPVGTTPIKLVVPLTDDVTHDPEIGLEYPDPDDPEGGSLDGWDMEGYGMADSPLFTSGNWGTGKIPSDLFSNYTVTAVSETGIAATPQHGGIHIATTLDVVPKVVFVDAEGKDIPNTEMNHKGNVLSEESTGMQDTGTVADHTVTVGPANTPLTWDATSECYTAATAQQGWRVVVDGCTTGVTLNADITKVPMYTVSVTDEPTGSAGADTANEKATGSFMIDRSSGTAKIVSYTYYPKGASVGVWAKTPKGGFKEWQGATDGKLENIGLNDSGTSAVGVNGTVSALSGNRNVKAVFDFKTLKIVTLYGGNDLTDTTLWAPGSGDKQVVFELTISGGGNTYTYAWDGAAYSAGTGLTEQTVGVDGGVPWSVTVPGNVDYTITINGRNVGKINPANDTPNADGIYQVYEIVGVIPKIEGTTKAGSTMTLPDDKMHGRALNANNLVELTGAKGLSGDLATLYYPSVADIPVEGVVAEKDTFKSLKYDGGEIPSSVDADSVWGIGVNEGDPNTTKFTKSGDKELVATFGASDGTAKVTVKKDTDAFTGLTVRLSSSDTAVSGDGVKVIPLNDTTTPSGVYSATAAPGKYYIWIGNAYTGKTLKVTAGDPPSEATVQYWTVSVSTDGNGKATVIANDKKDLVIGGADAASAEASGTTPATVVVIEGTSVTWAFGQANDYYEADKWEGGANHNAITATVGTDTVKSQKALFKKLKATVTIHVKKGDDAADFTDYAKEIKLTTSATSETTNPVTLTETNDYTFTASLEAGETTYYIWATTNAAGSTYKQVGSFTVPDDTAIDKYVNYYTLTVAANTDVDTGATAGVAHHETTAPTDGTTKSIVVLSGEKAMVKAFPSGSNYEWSEWRSSDNDTLPKPTTQTAQVTTVTKDITLTAYFTKPKYDTKLNLKLTDAPVEAVDDDITNIKLTVGSNTYTIGDGDGKISYDETNKVWVAHGVTNVAGNNGTWTVTTRNGDYTVGGEGDNGTASMELFVVKTAAQSTYENSQADMTANNTNDLTRAIVEVGTDITNLAVDTKTGYTHSGWTVTGAANSEAVDFDNATFELTKKTTSEVTLTPTFTYIATIVPTVGTTNTVCDVNTVVLTAKDATNTNTTVGTPTKITAEGADKGKWTVTGLTIGTEYAIWVNGHKSDKTVAATAEVKVPMWTVSVATTTGGTVALTTTSKLSTTMPNGATYAGWTITATKSNGYRLGDAAGKVWKLTTGNTIGALSDDEAAAPTLSVPNPITGNVVATAYFTQQFDATIKLKVNDGNADTNVDRAYFTKEDNSGTGTALGNPAVTATVDKDGYVVGHYVDATGQTLTSWTVVGGKLYTSADKTTEITSGAANTTKTVYFFPTAAGATITANVVSTKYTVQVQVNLDTAGKTDATVELHYGTNQVAQMTHKADGLYESNDKLSPDTDYQVFTNVTGSMEDAEKTIRFTAAEGDAGKNLKATVDYWTVTLAAADHGKEAFATSAPSADATTRTKVVLDGGSVSIAANPDTNYKFDTWATDNADAAKGAFGSAVTTAVNTYTTIKTTTTLTPSFVQKTGTVTVTVKLDGQKDDKSTDETVHTVKLYQVGAGDGGADKLIGTKTGKSGEYSFTGVPYNQGAGKYYITAEKKDAVTGAKLFTSAQNIEFSGDDGDTKTVDAPYFTAIAATEGNGNASINFGGDSGTTQKTNYTDDAQKSVKFVVASGTQVTWQAHEDKANYTFDKWTEDNSTDATRTDVTVNTANKTFTAKFKKDAFNTYLYLTVNGDPYGENAAVGSKDIKSVKLVTAKGGNADAVTLANAAVTPTYDGTAKVWKAENVKSEGQEPWWRVETVDGGVYYKQANLEDKSNDVPLDLANNKAVVREPLFGVVIERGAGNDDTATYTPTLQAQVGSNPQTRIVTEAEVAATVDLNKKGGYTWSKWLSKQSAAPADTDTLDTTNHGTSTTTTTADGTFTLVKGYTAPATGDDKDLHIKPVYTFTTTIVTKYKTDPTDVTTVQINDGTTTTTVNKETAGTGNHTGRYTASGLDPEKTYTIIVNGFPSTVTCDKNNAGADVDVTIFKVTVEKKDKKNNTLTPDGNAYVKLGATAIGTTDKATSVYLPEGAKTTAATNDATTIHLAAAAGTAYRLHNKDNADTDAYDEILWSVPTLAETLKMTIDTTDKTGDQTPNNLTIGGDNGMGTDVTVKAMFVRQYDLTVSAVTTEDAAANNSQVKLTADPKGLGTVMTGTPTGQSVKVTKVDAKTYIKVEYVHGVGEDFKGWSYAEADGDLYSALKADGTVDTTKRIVPAALTTPGGKENTTVYFVPKKDGATLKAVVKPAEYTVQVKVNLDNTEYPYNNGDLKVWLYTDETTPKKVTELTYNTTDKVFKGDVLPGTYRVYVNGEDLTKDPVFTEAAKNISFNADQAEGTVAGGGAAGQNELKKEINYYHVNLAVNPANTGAIVNKVGFGSTMPNGSTGTASKIYLAKTVVSADNGVQPIAIIAGAYDDNNKTHFRFDKWEQTGPNDGATTPTPITIGEFAHTTTQEQETYKLPNEATLTATNDDGSFKIRTDNQLTLTATFVQQYKVKVQLKDSSLGSYAEAKQKKNAAATTYTEIEVNVDKGSSAYIKGTVTGVDYAFAQWSIKADNGKGKFANNETLDGEGVIGYLAEDTFTPEQDSILELELWWAGMISKDGWEYDKADATKSVAGSGELKKMLWTPHDGQTPTEVWVKKTTDTSEGYGTKLTKDTHYTVTANADGTTTFEFDEAYLKGLDIASYTATFVYTLGAAGHKINYTGWTKTGAFSIKATKQDLTKVDIQVKDGELPETPDDVIHGSATANVDEEDRNAVRYEDHTVTNVPKADLLYQWYYSDKEIVRKIEGSSGLTVFKDDPAGTANAKTAMEKGEAFLTNATATYGIVKLDGQTADNLSIASNDTLKGKYVFALVWVDDSSDVAQGAVITNAISVDYDAKITLRQDATGNTATDPVTDAKAGNYAVYLWPTDGGTFDVTSNKAIQATHVTGADNDGMNTGVYSTKGSKLNANTSYHIYVLETEGMTKTTTANYVQWTSGGNPVVISRTTTPPTYVDYYTVRVTDMSASSTFTHATTAKQANDPAAAETFTTYPTFIVTTPKGATINTAANAKGVLKGTAIGVKANALKDKTVGWDQDYTLAWQDKEGAETNFTDAASKLTQSSTTAVSTGYPYTNSLANKVDFTGRLTQNTYTLTGIIRDVNNTGSPSGGKVASATLTKGEGDAAVKYNHKSITLSGFNNGVVSFVVPRGTYKLNSVEASDSTHKGHWNGGADKVWPLGHLNDAEAGEVTLAELTAQTPNATVADQFTIYVAATLRQTRLTDSDNNHDTGDVSRTDVAVRTAHTAGTDETPSKDLIVFNYDPIDKVVTVTNTGNTTLKLKSVLTKKGLTAADTTFAAVTLTNGADTNGVTFKYTHTVAADGTETTLTTPEALTTDATGTGAEFTLQPGEARKVTIHIPDDLVNADDVTYRLDFTSVDGRPVADGVTPAKGPTVGYTLDIEIKPITIRRVTTENVGGTFHVQDHWLKDDALNNNQPDTDATYSAGGEAHTWAAETLGTGHTLMDHLVKQGQNVDGDVATADPTKSDIKYRWYVADADAEKPTINTTTGELTFPGNKGHEVTADVGSNGTAYTPTEADHGKMLYLVAVGQRNATNAVMTPDATRFEETPVPIPYPATITLWENKMGGSGAERTKVKADDKGNYSVWLWDVTGGKTDELDTTDTTGRAIEAEAVAGEDGTYKTDVVLYPDHTYQVWTSAAKKADGAAFYLRNTGITIDSVDHKDKNVDYYLVDVANTTLSQNDYEGKLGEIADNSTIFYNANDLTGVLEKPSAKMPAKGETAATLDVVNNYVLKNTDVTLGYPARTLDYDLNWTGGYTNGGNPDAPGAAVTHVVNYSAATAQIKTELKLKVYDVVAWVTGSLGSVDKIAMTMNDGVVNRVFTTTGDAAKGEIAGLKNGETVPSISTTDQNKTFHLPKANYDTVATYDDSVYTLQCYKYPHSGEDKGKENFVVPVTADTSYDVVLQGEGFSMQVADDVDVQTQKNTNSATGVTVSGVWSDSADPKRQDGSQTQTIKLNYNYNEDQKVKLTVTNASQQPKDVTADRVILYDITFTADATADNPIILSTDTGDTNSFAGGAMVDSLDDKGSATVTLKIPSGLNVGKYEYTAKFDFKTTDGGADGASATYKLVVEVEPLTFNSVDVKKDTDGTLIIDPAADKQYTVTRKVTAEDGETPNLIYRDLPNTTTTGPDTNGKLIQDTDYGYQWISAPVSMSYDDVKAAVSWSNGALTVTEAANGVKKGSGADATQKVYTPKDADSGRSLFLVIYGKDNATGTRRNATSFAISPAQVNTYKGMVALKVDDAGKRGKDDADSADVVNKPNDGDGYEVWFISKDNATVKKQATWTKVGTEYAYVADLIPNENGYSVEISRAKDSDKKVALPDALITGANVKTTIDTTGSNVVEAPFFTVNAVNFINEEYKTGTGETFTATITPIITIGADHAELANHTPVLSGQSVAAKAPAMADPNGDKAWEQDYTLTWRNTTGNDKNITVDDKTNLTDETNNAYKGQSATAAIADGAYAYGAVSAKTFIGGRLDQTTYTIVGTIHGPTGNAKQVKNVTLTSGTVIYYSDTNTATGTQTGIKSGTWTKDNGNNGLGNNGDEVTFTVVKGTYTVTGYEDANFTIRKVTVEGTDAASTPRNEKTFTQSVEKLTEAKRIFDIYLEATGPKLTVNDTENPANEATSTPTDDHKFADNNDGAHYYYKQLTADDVFTLELSNPGNVDLKLKAPEVYKLDTGTDYSNMQTALSGKTALTNLNVKDGTRTILTFAGLPVANDDVKVGESVSRDGTALDNAGTITVSKDVYNKDDAIYVVKFASEYLTTDGVPAVTGPTVYYVLDLKVEPLPIKKVTAETDPTKTDGTLRLKDNDLDSVLVDHDLSDATDLIGAKDAGLAEGDISYVWYSAPTSATVVAGDFDFDTTGMKLTAQGTAKGLKQGENANNGKTYKPSDAEQGLNFYLVAYRTDADKNASEFAVSDGVYAQVTIAMKAYRTGKVNKSDTEATPLLTEVNISTMVGEDKKTSNDDTVTVTGVADNANVLTFNATKTDVTATGAADDPAAAKWYFKSWAVQPQTGDELDATDTSIVTPVDGERLTMNYTATGKATVIGYFDKLPELKEDKGYNVEAGVADNKADRTFHYEPNDGSGAGKVQIWIQPVNGNTWKNDNSAENKKPKQLTAALMIPPAAGAGAQGDYELTKTFLDNNLWQSDDSGDYRITFFDMERGAYSAITATNDGFEGTPREGGYAGYDRSVIYSITEGEKTVIAKVTNSGTETAPVYWGQVKITNTALTDNENGPGDTATLATQGGSVRLFAIPKDGYAFAGWSKPDNEPNSKGKFGNTADAETPYTGVRQTTETVIATFRKGDFTPQADAKTSVYYGDDALQETNDTLVVSVTKDKDTSVTQDFTYDLATETELTAYLNGAARPDNAYTKDGVEVVPGDATKNTNVVPTWLDVKKDDTDNTKVNFTVKAGEAATGVNVQKTADGEDVEDELVVYLKVTEDNTEESKIVPVTINVITSDLKIKTANSDDEQQKTLDGNAYLALFEAATNATYPGEGRKPDHEEKVYYDYFAYQNVHNKHNPTGNVVDTNSGSGDHAANAAGANRWDKTDGALNADYGVVSNGYWTVAPVAFDGTGTNGYVAGQENTNDHDYKFTFHYTGDPDDDADNYNYNDAEITLTIPALVPEMSLKFADTLKTTTQGGDPKALLTLTKGTHSGEVTGDGYVKDDADNHAPISLAYANEANRKDEHLTYLDEEPVFHVTLQKIGNLKRVELSATDVDGFETELPTITIDPNATTQTAEFDVKLTHMKDNAKLWAGTHTIKITAKGYYDDATGAEKFITATYELEIVIDPRLITAVDVTTEYDETKPTDVTPTIEGDPTLNEKGEDTKGNTPIKDAAVTWETEDAKNPVPVKETVTVEIDPNYKIVPDDIKPETELNGKNDKDTPESADKNPDPNTEVTPEAPAEDKTDGGKITITQLHPILMFNDQKEGDDNSKAGPAVNHVRHLTSVKVGSDPTALGKVLIDLGAYSSDVYDVDVEVKFNDFAANGGVLTPELPEGQLLWPQIGMIAKDGKTHYVMDLTGLDTSKAMAYVLRLEAKGTEKDGGAQTILATYELHLRVTPNSPPPSGGGEVCPCKVFYHVGLHGTTTDATVEDVSESNRPSKIPTVTALDGYAFRGWSLTNPATLKQGEKIELVDPKTVTVKGDAMTFYAVIVERPFHEHYVIGYPNGNFGPADNINRASVATIIARAILPDFVEGANYGNPGGYSDVSGHWAESAIAYCSKFDVFKGYTDGTFRPDQPITRQEFATVIARLDGELTAKDIPFDDIDEAGDWAMNGIYTSYEKGWVNGYTDGTFKPLNNIRRDEAVKVFNAYLNRGVDADGLADLHEYVHTGVASNNTENGVDEYMTWPDVPKGHWAYYEIVEAANDHEFTPDFDAELGYTLPEHWEKCWIDERWRYGDGPSGGDSAAMVSAGFQVWLH